MIIKFYDNENYEYPLLSIVDDGFKEFKEILDKYQKDEEYNFDDFIKLIEDYNWFNGTITYDTEVFF